MAADRPTAQAAPRSCRRACGSAVCAIRRACLNSIELPSPYLHGWQEPCILIKISFQSRAMTSPADSVLDTLHQLQRRVLFGGGAVMTALLLMAGGAALWLLLETVHQEQRDALRRGLQVVDRYVGERRRAYAASLNTNVTLWTTQQPVLLSVGTPLREHFAAQHGQLQVRAPGALSVPWLVLSPPQSSLPPQAQAAYLGMVETYSAYMAATVAAQDSPHALISAAFEPEGRLFAISGLQNEAQLLQTMRVQTREQALTGLRNDAEQGWLRAGAEGELRLSSGRLRVYFGQNPLTGEEALVTQMRLISGGLPLATRLTYEPLRVLRERLAETDAGTWVLQDRDGNEVLRSGAETIGAASMPIAAAPPGDVQLQARPNFSASAPVQGLGWHLLRPYSWSDVWTAQRSAILAIGAALTLLIAALWAVLLRVERRVLRPALRQAEQVHESEALSRTLIETLPVGLCLLDQQQGQVILYNQALKDLAGGTAVGVAELLPQVVQAGSRPDQPLHVPSGDPGGAPRFLRSIVAPARYQRQSIWVCAVTDVTAQEETRRHLMDAHRHAEQARRDAEAAEQAKSAFIAMITHEIRTPLSGVLGHLELLARQPMPLAAQNHTARARTAAGVLQTLVNNTLDLSRIEAGLMQVEPVAFDPRALVRQTVTLFEPQAARKRLQLVADVGDDVAPAYLGDAHRLAQIVNNFVGNAVKFTEMGAVTIRVDACTAANTAEELRFEVCDTGPGIETEKQATLFEPFVQASAGTARQHGGSGLGLALCQRFAKLMGGRVGVASTPGVGSCFHVVVPTARSTLIPAHSLTADPAEEGVATGGHALLVDDTTISREVTMAQLQELGWQVTAAENGAQALRHARQEVFDIVLTDLNMPNMDGYMLARRLRAERPSVPVLALTASTLPEDAERARAAGIVGLLLKPLDLTALQDTLRTLGDRGSLCTAATPVMIDQMQMQLRDAFLQTAQRDLDALTQAMKTGDVSAMVDLLHSFAGALAFLAEDSALRACLQAEQSLRMRGAVDSQADVEAALQLVSGCVHRFETRP